jgi:hypothetical protein
VKQPSKRQQKAEEQAKALVEFAVASEKPFVDLEPYRGESEMMGQYLTVSAILRRLRIAEAAGMVPLHGPERRVFNKLRAELVEKCFWLQEATTHERVTRRIREGTI